ncbi:Wzz/FepE/Etk N-terminal domain-containing protein [Dyella sp. Tek66A03]|uniref:Wzz/FepE/Etk N-terminal domain-containing protein n=1 Tax=Dyella sp. Tek66A03 TaxID=3458298 RepID=UPI00403EAD95
MERDEIYLVDMWRIVVREWKWFLLMVVLVLAATYAFTHVARRQWEATAWIQIAQVGQVPQGQDPKVEPLQRVAERLQTKAFQNEVVQSLGLPLDSREAGLYRKSLKVDQLQYAGALVRLTVRADSARQARQFAEATVAQLRVVHQGLEATTLALARARLDEVQADLKDALAERDRLLQTAGRGEAGDKSGQASSLAGVLVASRGEEIRNLQTTRSDLLTRLSASYTYETSLLWPVYVPEGQVFPNAVLFWGVGILAALGLGTFAAVVRNALRRRV